MDKPFEQKSRTLFFFCSCCFCFIFARIFLLCTVKNEELEKQARKYQQKTVLVLPQRGTLRDHNNHPLAINKLELQATIIFDPIQQLPRFKYQNIEGKKKKIPFRKNYIEKVKRNKTKLIMLFLIFYF